MNNLDAEQLREELHLLFYPEPDEDGLMPVEYPHTRLKEHHKLAFDYMDSFNWEGASTHPFTTICPEGDCAPSFAPLQSPFQNASVAIAPDGRSFAVSSPGNVVTIFRRSRPEWWWGCFYLPQVWAALALGLALVDSPWRDGRRAVA